MDRNKLIYKYYLKGKKQTDIARMFKLSRQRIGQIIKRQTPNFIDRGNFLELKRGNEISPNSYKHIPYKQSTIEGKLYIHLGIDKKTGREILIRLYE